MMSRYCGITLLFFLNTVSFCAFSQTGNRSERIRPQWVESPDNIYRSNNTFEIRMISSEGGSLETLEQNRVFDLASYLKTKNNVAGEIEYESNLENKNGDYSVSSVHKLSFTNRMSTESFEYKLIADYWEFVDPDKTGGYYKYYTLYALSVSGVTPVFDGYDLTTQYGIMGLWRSAIVPGWGQMYKGSYLKGGMVFGGAVAFGGGALACHLLAKDNLSKMDNNHSGSVKQQYRTRVNALNTGMYCCLGGLAALYVYNLVDAAVAPGARRVIVYPAASVDCSVGLGAAVRF